MKNLEKELAELEQKSAELTSRWKAEKEKLSDDLQPEMSAIPMTDAVVDALKKGGVDFVCMNFANPDMVGHTGSLEAAVKACATVDACVGAIIDATLNRQGGGTKGGSLIITADHANCEQMWDPATNAPHTAHTIYDVPLHIVGPTFKHAKLQGDFDKSGWFNPATRAARGRLADILPTALAMMGLPAPSEMSGRSLIQR